MDIMHELNQLEMGGSERVVAGIIKHDTENKHIVYSYKDGPMHDILKKAGAEIVIESEKETANIDLDIIHIHTGGNESTIANAVKGMYPVIETIHSPVVSAVRDKYVSARIGVSNQITKLNRNCRTIYNGVDLDRLNNSFSEIDRKKIRDKLNIPYDSFVVGRIGRIGQDKCLEEFLITCYKFQKYDDCHVIIVGGEAKDSSGYLAKVKIMTASLPVKNVTFIKETEDVSDYYGIMDVFLYPSPTEGFGLVYFEAMACGIPVVTWENDLTRELFLGDAYLQENTINGLVEGIQAVKNHPDIVREIALHAKERVIDDFSEKRMSEQYQKIYKEQYKKYKKKEVHNVTT